MKINLTLDEIMLIYDALCEYHPYSKTEKEEALIEKIKAKLAGRFIDGYDAADCAEWNNTALTLSVSNEFKEVYFSPEN